MKVKRVFNYLLSLKWFKMRLGMGKRGAVKLSAGAAVALFLLFILIAQGQSAPSGSNNSNALRHGIRLQPELDKIDIDAYLKNKKALRIQVQCLIYDGPCDWVGRWLKPRAAAALLGECLLCTEHQKIQLPKIMDFIQVNFPEEFKIGIKKYLLELGIDVPADRSTTTRASAPGTESSTERAAATGLIESTRENAANNSTTPVLLSTSLSPSSTTAPATAVVAGMTTNQSV